VDAGSLVVGEGDRAAATGRLVRNDLGDWFEPPGWIAGPVRPEGRVRPVSKSAVRVAGADFGAATRRFELDGAVEGWATVTGTWSGGQLRAERQDPPAPRPAARVRWVTPPCPPPEGGWPAEDRHSPELSRDLDDLTRMGAAVAVTWFRPGENQPVLVVAAADPTAVEARLRPRLGGSLCVVPSRWTKAQLDDVASHLHQRLQQWDLYQLSRQRTGDGQACIGARLVRVLPQIAAWAGSLPPGIVAFEPWLRPAKDDHGTPPESPAASPSVCYRK
jgi:hypothetical protein